MAEKNPPNNALTDQADLGYRVVSRLVGRVSSAERSVRAERNDTSLTIIVVDGDGSETQADTNTPVTMYFEQPDPSLAGSSVKIVAGKVDARGRVSLGRADQDKVIESLIVRLGTGDVTVGRVPRPKKRKKPKPPAAAVSNSPAKKAPARKSPAKKAPARARRQATAQLTSQPSGE